MGRGELLGICFLESIIYTQGLVTSKRWFAESLDTSAWGAAKLARQGFEHFPRTFLNWSICRPWRWIARCALRSVKQAAELGILLQLDVIQESIDFVDLNLNAIWTTLDTFLPKDVCKPAGERFTDTATNVQWKIDT